MPLDEIERAVLESKGLPENIFALCVSYAEAYEKVAQLKGELDGAKQELHDRKEELFEWWRAQPDETRPPHLVTPRTGMLVFVTGSYHRVADREAFEAWCRKEGLDPIMFYQPSWQRVQSYCNERLDERGELPQGVESYDYEKIQKRKP